VPEAALELAPWDPGADPAFFQDLVDSAHPAAPRIALRERRDGAGIGEPPELSLVHRPLDLGQGRDHR
jgi:hypothetical protein